MAVAVSVQESASEARLCGCSAHPVPPNSHLEAHGMFGSIVRSKGDPQLFLKQGLSISCVWVLMSMNHLICQPPSWRKWRVPTLDENEQPSPSDTLPKLCPCQCRISPVASYLRDLKHCAERRAPALNCGWAAL